ncbi:MAG: O-antigen ligase family protein [Caldilineales bacterium]|nr:O-antigen ligase family protein [Caldilineales bacterium]
MRERFRASRLAEGCFATFLVLALGTYSEGLTRGPLTWWPLVHLPWGGQVGMLALIPAAWLVFWAFSRRSAGRPWQWGPQALTLPLAAYTAWALTDAALLSLLGQAGAAWGREPAKALLAFAILWPVYLYLINERPRLAWPLALVVALHGAVALGQVWKQDDLGLTFLGEEELDPQRPGVIVLSVAGQRWLRAYGLASGPNALGACLVTAGLLLLPTALRARGDRAWVWAGVLGLGLLGVLASFSRSAWLALGLALAVWAIIAWRSQGWRPFMQTPVAVWAVPLLAGGVFLLANVAALSTRFVQLETPLEARSLNDRRREATLTLSVIAERPLLGVGPGHLAATLKARAPKTYVVHNVPLLVTAETGLIGGALWLALMGAGLFWAYKSARLGSGRAPALWLSLIVPGLFGPWWPTISWRVGVLLALVWGALAQAPTQSDQTSK